MLGDHTAQLTTPVSSHLLFLGDTSAIVDAGVGACSQRLIDELRPFTNGDYPLSHVLLTHTHFDHVGGIPFLRRAYPSLVVVGSPKTAEILADRARVQEIYDLNLRCAEALGEKLDCGFDEFFANVRVDKVVNEGEVLYLGDDVDVKVVSSPGHAEESTGYFIKIDSAFAAGEAVGGYAGRDRVTACFLTSKTQYTDSIQKILGLDIKILGLPHSGALTGDLAKRFLIGARDEADRFSSQILERYSEGMIPQEILIELLGDWAADGIAPEGPFAEAQEMVAKRMLDLILANAPTRVQE